MSNLEKLGKVNETDVLVVGGGLAGLWAANIAKKSVDRVLIVDKGPEDWGGVGSMAGGDFEAVLPNEDPADFVKDLVYYYDGLCQQDVVEEIYKHSYERMQDYQKWGCEFLTDASGKLKGIPQRSLEHVKLYPAKLGTQGGPVMVRCLVKEANRLGVKRMHRTVVSDLIKDNGKISGAVGFDTYTGEFHIFKAKAVVLSVGQAGWKSTRLTCSGEGMWMAAEAGAELTNCEFIHVHNQPRLFEWEGQTKLLPLGARFVNAKNETFMNKYAPKFGANTDTNFNVLGMSLEAREGRGPFYLDTSPVKDEDIELVKPHSGWQLLNYQKLLGLGINVFKEKTEWMPAPVALYAGIVADAAGRTCVPGLFTAGRSRLVDGGVYIGGFALCNTAVTGHIAGESAAEYAKSNKSHALDETEIAGLKKKLFAPMEKQGPAPREVLNRIREIIFPYNVCIVKNEKSLNRATGELSELKAGAFQEMSAKDFHYLMKWMEVKGILNMSECFLRASLMRNESRSGHYREDHPRRDDKNWLKWIVFSLKNGQLSNRLEPVPFGKYKYKPERYYTDNLNFPGMRD
jgi:succinate dehydrogenase/fumarate reductase flavoprotein subunit